MYANGLGVKQDAQIAINLYKKAIAKDYAPCFVSMGALYENGTGVAKIRRLLILIIRKLLIWVMAEVSLRFHCVKSSGSEQGKVLKKLFNMR